jgi:hypothetical protein
MVRGSDLLLSVIRCRVMSVILYDSVGVLLSVSRPRVGVATAHTARAGESLRLARERGKLSLSRREREPHPQCPSALRLSLDA